MSLREIFRDHARDELCAGLLAMGIRAQMSDRGRPGSAGGIIGRN